MLPETKEEFMVEVLGNLLSVGRGLHIQPEEKDSSNLKNDNISRAYLLNYDDIKNYSYYLSNMLDVKVDKKTEVYVNLDKRYKNSIPKNFDIVIPQRTDKYNCKGQQTIRISFFHKQPLFKAYVQGNTCSLN